MRRASVWTSRETCLGTASRRDPVPVHSQTTGAALYAGQLRGRNREERHLWMLQAWHGSHLQYTGGRAGGWRPGTASSGG